jgi:CBS-domain-containing membrane protein
LDVPLVGLQLSQDRPSETVYESVPPPLFRTVKLWFEGLDPCTQLAESVEALSSIAGSALTVSVTPTVCGLFAAPAAVIVIAPLYVPAARLEAL